MSCTVCRLPFIPSPRSTSERLYPPSIKQQSKYFQSGLAIGYQILGVVAPVDYLDDNLFTLRAFPQMIQWESDGGTFVICHAVCGALLRRTLNAEDDSARSLANLVELERIFGRTQEGRKAGRFPHINYEEVRCGRLLRVDVERLWSRSKTGAAGENDFDWMKLNTSDLAPLWTRPDTFPKFHTAVGPERLKGLKDLPVTNDLITNLPTDVLELLISYMMTPTYVCFTSTCRILRRQALTEWQKVARARVLELGWAVPLPSEYALAKKYNIVMASAEESPLDADWMLYLSHVHRTKSMNVREWIWGICQVIKRTRDELKPTSAMADVEVGGKRMKSAARKELEKQIQQTRSMFAQMAKSRK
ncbi:hypothetical protein NEOLEDRAFT_1084927 [Neolentinus lepideus HHB14362 ss-1]|uniref:F-box domain-containing protein n=1 Tax=Neolentinus lepideus HHB14362 ss-1 TaxID=1314782 RepID=A0A165VP99_9AGAM|nr:hypothetical protein NEOLEDRAFT_1084927 [Neolentinus lepideus HHB14362 ss-1]